MLITLIYQETKCYQTYFTTVLALNESYTRYYVRKSYKMQTKILFQYKHYNGMKLYFGLKSAYFTNT